MHCIWAPQMLQSQKHLSVGRLFDELVDVRHKDCQHNSCQCVGSDALYMGATKAAVTAAAVNALALHLERGVLANSRTSDYSLAVLRRFCTDLEG